MQDALWGSNLGESANQLSSTLKEWTSQDKIKVWSLKVFEVRFLITSAELCPFTLPKGLYMQNPCSASNLPLHMCVQFRLSASVSTISRNKCAIASFNGIGPRYCSLWVSWPAGPSCNLIHITTGLSILVSQWRDFSRAGKSERRKYEDHADQKVSSKRQEIFPTILWQGQAEAETWSPLRWLVLQPTLISIVHIPSKQVCCRHTAHSGSGDGNSQEISINKAESNLTSMSIAWAMEEFPLDSTINWAQAMQQELVEKCLQNFQPSLLVHPANTSH